MDNSPEAIRAQMQTTRAALTGKLGTLEEQVFNKVQGASSAVTESAEMVKDAVHDTVNGVKDTLNLPLQMQRHPWVFVGGAVLLGYFGARLLSRNGAAQAAANACAPDSKPANGARGPGWLTEVKKQFTPEIAKIKGFAVSGLLSAIRDMITESAPPPMQAALADAIDGITVKLGGEPARAAAASKPECAGTTHPDLPNSPATAGSFSRE
jgi:hypothetical protein